MSASEDVDYRFILANERTFLAWIRTALGIIAGGVALDQFVTIQGRQGLVAQIAIGAVALGAIVAIMGTIRWSRVDRAMREQQPLGRSRGILIVGVGVALIAGVLVVLLLRG